MITLFGIKNCDTVKKARHWLEARGVEYHFHDLRIDGIRATMLRGWIEELGWEVLLNRRGQTWRALPEGETINLDAQRVCELMLAHPTLIKRPVLDLGDCRCVGFDPNRYAEHFGRK